MTNNSTSHNRLFLRFSMLAFMLACMGSSLTAQLFFKSAVEYNYTSGSYGGNIAGVSIDMDGDGDLDIVGMEEANSQTIEVIVAINNGNGVFNTSSKRTGVPTNRDFAVGDLNNDGLPDVVVVGHPSTYTYKVMLNITQPGGPVLLASTIYSEGPTNQQGEGVSIADFNNDGNNDFVITKSNSSSREFSVFLGDGTGAGWSPTQNMDVPNASELRKNIVGDFDGDGFLDIVANRSGGSKIMYFFKGNSSSGVPTGTFQSAISFSSSITPYKLLAADINEDGLMDIIVNGRNDGLYNILINDNDNDGTTYNSSTISAWAPSDDDARGMTMHDMDGDGHLDLLASDGSFVPGLARVFFMKGNGDGTFQTAITYGYSQNNPSGEGVTVGDYNGDGLIDMASMDHDLWVFINSTETILSLDQGGVPLNSGDTHDFGFVSTGGNSGPVTFTITNNGDLEGTLNGSSKIVVSGPDASMFTVNESNTSSTIASGGTTTFTATFTPSGGGNRSAVLSIPSNDKLSPYTINVTGVAPKIPDAIDIADGNICVGGQTTLTQLGGILDVGEDWVWYSGSCGGTLVGVGESITVSPTVATDYFVRAENSGTPITACVFGQVMIGPAIVINITSEPAALINGFDGDTQLMSVTATGSSPVFQWYKSGVAMTDGGRISGSQTNTLTISALEEADQDIYTCIVSNSCGQDTTGDISLNVVQLPPNDACGTVLDFDGTNDHVNVGNTINPTNAITLEAWINSDAIGLRQDIIDKSAPGNVEPFYQYHLDLRPNGTINFSLALDGTRHVSQTTTAITANEWHHIAATYDGSNMRIYIDGIEETTESASGNISLFSEPLLIGRGFSNTSRYFDGKIDEVRIWQVARTQTEISVTKDVELQGNENGLLGYWNFNEGVKSVLNDQTSNGLDGALTNMDPLTDWVQQDGLPGGNSFSEQTVSVFSSDSYEWNGTTYTADGIYTTTLLNAVGCDSLLTLNLTFIVGPPNTSCDNVLDFDGTDDHVDLGDVIEPTAEITLEAWVKTDAVGVRQDIIDKAFSGSVEPFYQYHLDLRPDGAINFSLGLVGGRVPLQTGSGVISANQWHHVAATYDGSTMRIYIDGIEEVSTSASGSIQNFSEPLKIGESFDGPAGSRPFNGQIDEVRIWEVARNQMEIVNNKDAQLLGNETNLAGYWNFDQGSGSEYLIDQTANEYHGVLTDMNATTDWMQLDGSVGGNTGSTLVIEQFGPYTSPSGNNTWVESGTYTDIIANTVGCDSTITVDLTINKLDQTITFESLGDQMYGDTDFTLSGTADSGLPVTFSSTDPSVATVSGNTVTIVGIGTTTITALQAGSFDYNPATNIDQTLTILAKPLSITANAGQTKVYGESDPVFTHTITAGSLESGDVLAGLLDRTAGEGVGSYAIGQGTLTAGVNYTITFVSDDFSINPKPITVTADLSQTKIYGQPDPVFNYNVSAGALEAGDAFSGSLDRVIGESTGNYPMGLGTLSAGPNYTINFISNDFSITPKPITVTADPSQTKVYGQLDPVFTYSPEAGALEAGDAFNGALDRVIGESTGNYSIGIGTLSVGPNYTITFVSNDFSITPKPITVTADLSQTKIYGQMDPVFTFSTEVGALEAGDAFTGLLNRIAGENAGNYAIGMGTLSAGPNYTITFVSNDFSITSKPITVTADLSQTKIYGQIDPVFTYSPEAAALEAGDAFSGALNRVAGENVGNYAIGMGTLDAGSNYTINFVSNDFSITPKSITVSADAGQSKIYGQSDPLFTYSLTAGSLESGDVLTGNPDRVAGENVGNYPIEQGTVSAGSDYSLTFESNDFLITKKALTATAEDKSRSYGDTNPVFTLSYVGFEFGEEESVIDTPPTASTIAGEMSNVGDYPITLTGGLDNNYDFTFIEGTLTIGKTSLMVAAGMSSQAYGGPGIPNGIIYTGFLNGDDESDLDVPIAVTTSVTPTTPVSVGSENSVTLNGGSDDNYNIVITEPNGTFEVTKASLTLVLDDQTRTYGAVNPPLTFTLSGFVNGEDETVIDNLPVFATNAVASSAVGDYFIFVTMFGFDDNYNIPGPVANFTVTPATLTAIADDQSRAYGEDNPTLSMSYTGFVNGDDGSVITSAPTAATIATTLSNVGDYPITISGGTADNYTFDFQSGTLSVAKAVLNATADNKSRTYGDANPALTVSYSGFVNGEDETILDNVSTAITSATTADNAGDYPITISAGTDNNYDVVGINGTLTINRRFIVGEIGTLTRNYGDPISFDGITYDFSGADFVNGDTEAVLEGTLPSLFLGNDVTSASPVGSYVIFSLGDGTALNYSVFIFSSILNYQIVPAPLSISADNKVKLVNDPNPALTVSYDGFVNGEDESVLTTAPVISTIADTSSPAGDYPIAFDNTAAADNYIITQIDGTMTVSEGIPLTITADTQSKIYGDSDPSFTYQLTSGTLMPGDMFTGELSRILGEDVGTYAIQLGTLTAGSDYVITLVSNDLTITPKALTITADANQSKVYGDADPVYTYIQTGTLESGDVLTGALARASGEDVGSYAIDEGTLTAGSNYDITFTGSNFGVTAKPLTITVDSGQGKIYGQSDLTFTYSETGLLGGDLLVGSLVRAAGEDVGNYAISQGSLAAGSNYSITFNEADFLITEKAITVTANAGQTKAYGQSDPIFGYTPSAGALEVGDTFMGSLARTLGESVGDYSFNQGTLSAGMNYAITFISNDFTITPKALTITADANQSKVFGEADPIYAYTQTGTLESGDVLTGALTRASGEDVGSYAINQGTLTAGSNYDITFTGSNFDITVKPLTITVNAEQEKVYGQSDPTLTYSQTGLVGGDLLVGSLARSAGEDVGSYAINQGSLTAGSNYDIAFTGSNFGITTKPLTISVNTGQEKVYGQSDPTITYSQIGTLEGGDLLIGSLARSAGEDVGSYAINQGTLTAGSNYDIAFTDSNFDITAKPLTITVNSGQEKVYGQSDPTFTFSQTGTLEGGDLLMGSLARVAGEDVGNYIINQGSLTAGSNYSITFNESDFIIIEKAITVTADANQSKVYGEVDPVYTYTQTGTLESGDVLTGELARTTGEDVGSYAIDQGTLTAGSNYAITFTGSNFDITAKSLTITTDANQIKVYGEADPIYNFTLIGTLEIGDVLTGVLARSAGEDVGSYAINQGTLTAGSNYDIAFTGSNFGITAKPLMITVNAGQEKVYGQSDPTFTYTQTGNLAGGDLLIGSLGRVAGEDVGSYAIDQGTLTAGSNYDITFNVADFDITAKPLTITADAGQSKIYGAIDPTLTYTQTGSLEVGDILIGSLARLAGEDVGSYAINQGNLRVGDNYSITFNDADFDITAKPLTIAADAGQSKIYGTTDPTFTYTQTGSLEVGDILMGSLARLAGEDVGTYAITQGSLSAGNNYSITFNDAEFDIAAKPLTITANAGQEKVYGQIDPTFTYSQTGTLEGGDILIGALARVAGEDVGSYTINLGSLTAGSNYSITFNDAGFDITAKPLTITVNSGQEKVYGQSDPSFTYSQTGTLEGGDLLVGSLGRSAGEDVGNYAISQGNLTAGSNYDITFNEADFIITEKAITVTADAGQTKVYGQTDPILDYTPNVGALEAGDTFMGLLVRTAGESVGDYSINQGTLSAGTNYAITFIPNDFSITAKSLTITADANQSKVYGQSDLVLGYTQIGLESGDPLMGTLDRAGGENVGTYAIIQGNLTAGSNYSITFNGDDFTITPRAVAVSVDANQSKVYGEPDPANYTFTESPTLEAGDSFTGTLTRLTGGDVGTYTITQGSLNAGDNYSITLNGDDFEITPRILEIVADNKTKVVSSADPVLTYTITSDNLVSGDFISGDLTREVGEALGDYAIQQGTLNAGTNYQINFTDGLYTITDKLLQAITFNTLEAVTYGDASFNVSASGGASGNIVTFSGDDPTVAMVSATGEVTIVGAGIVNITASQTGDAAYAAADPITQSLTVNQAPLTINASDQDMIYGDAALPTLTATFAGFVDGEDATVLTTAPILSTIAMATSDAGTYPISITGATATNYQITDEGGVLTIGKAALTVIADNQTRVFNEENQTLTLSYGGFTGDDTEVDLDILPTASTIADVNSDAGVYVITASGGLDNNYAFLYEDGSLTVNQVTLSVTADDQSKTYGDANPSLSLNYVGFVGTDEASVLDNAPVGTTSADATSEVGTYTISVGGGSDVNYTFNYTDGNLTIGQATLIVIADDHSKTYNESNPLLTLTYSGFVNGEDTGVLDTSPIASTTATQTSDTGTYPITVSGGNSTNYGFSYTGGALTINKADQAITFDALTDKTEGDADFDLTALASSGLSISYASSDETIATVEGSTVTIHAAGTTTITASQSGGTNFNVATDVSQTLTVNAIMEDQTITFEALDNQSYGASPFELTGTASSGLAVVYASSDDAVATVDGNTVTVHGVGNTMITASQSGNDRFNSAEDVIQTLIVDPATLTIKADDKTRTYGDANPGLTLTYSGFVNGEDVSVLDTAPTGTTSADASSEVGTYIISAAGGSDVNYTFNYMEGSLTVDQATLSVSADDQSKSYNESNPSLTLTYSGFVNGEDTSVLDTSPSASTTATQTSDAGTYPISVSGGSATNYGFSYNEGSLTINKADQAINFDALTDKTAGDADFDLTARASSGLSISYMSSDETIATIEGSTVTILAAGTTMITASQSGGTNFNAAMDVTQTLTVNDNIQDQTITFETLVNQTYGASPFELAATASSGLAVVYTSSDDAVATVSGNTLTVHGVGIAMITANQSGNDRFNSAEDVSQTLIVDPATLTIRADDKTRTYGDANPTLTLTYTGFVNGEDVTILTTSPTVNTAADANSAAGIYEIFVEGGGATNYTLTRTSGNLTVSKATLVTTADDQLMRTGDAVPTLTISYSGFVNGDVVADIDIIPAINTAATSSSASGLYDITLTGGEDNNYELTLINGTLTIETVLGLVLEQSQIMIYPNPVIDKLYIDFPQSLSGELIKVELFDLEGRKLQSKEVEGFGIELDVKEIPAGLLILQMSTGDEVIRKRLRKD